TFRESCKSA
ncbi:cytochrome c554 and c-prime family protein, partial [Vibrio parahaemolyticus V-223/04]